MHKHKREAARTRKNKSAHFTKSDVIAAIGTGQSKSPALEKLTLKIPADALALVKAISAFRDTTPEDYALAALCSCLNCDVNTFPTDAGQILATLEGGAK